MDNEQLPAAPASSSAGGTTTTPNSTGTARPAAPQISVYSGIPDRQTVQVIQQALHRQPNTAAQYLQQMYAAQQQHLMLQTAALQQQHLTSAQLQSLAAVQQPPALASVPGMTSGTGSSASTVAGAAPQNGENKPPQAIVKPQILTHVIEGFVIQEGAEPFPVGRSSLLVGNLKKKYAQELLAEKLPPQDNTTTTDSEMEEPYLQESKEEGNPPKLKCELCGRVDFAYKFKRSKRFCSMACAKR
ncbi:polyhomeotic-like protein 2 [Amazona aestiva]|uniref:Polyhomeotic-like protein 2 n=1 Tax=Amazona aestiva TaxID=12930 RepID=A0A0Q3Q3C5_AMAAE|nr:polyhomeotic-like protein 2 [Amazona aestiva]